ncbi:hypothetical protein Droror1_Dr00003348 [Drosera rotundifolia]
MCLCLLSFYSLFVLLFDYLYVSRSCFKGIPLKRLLPSISLTVFNDKFYFYWICIFSVIMIVRSFFFFSINQMFVAPEREIAWNNQSLSRSKWSVSFGFLQDNSHRSALMHLTC